MIWTVRARNDASRLESAPASASGVTRGRPTTSTRCPVMAGNSASTRRSCTGSRPSAPATAVATPSAMIWVSPASGGTRFTVSGVGNGTGTPGSVYPPRAVRRARGRGLRDLFGHGGLRRVAPEAVRSHEEVDQVLEREPVGGAERLEVGPRRRLVPEREADFAEHAPGHLEVRLDEPRGLVPRGDVETARYLEHRPPPTPVDEVGLPVPRALDAGRGERGRVRDDPERGDPRLALVLGAEEGEHRVRDVALEEVRDPLLPLGERAVEQLEVAARRVHRDHADGGDPAAPGIVEREQPRLAAAVRGVEGREVRDHQPIVTTPVSVSSSVIMRNAPCADPKAGVTSDVPA